MADLSSVLREISHWPSYELFRLMSAIGHKLEDPERILAIKRHLRIGQKINYYLPEQDKEIKATLLKFMRQCAVVEDVETKQQWEVPYHAIHVEFNARTSAAQSKPQTSAKVPVSHSAKPIAAKPKLTVGDDVTFLDRHQQAAQGKVVSLHDRTVTVSCKGTYRRVAYEYLSKLEIAAQVAKEPLISVED